MTTLVGYSISPAVRDTMSRNQENKMFTQIDADKFTNDIYALESYLIQWFLANGASSNEAGIISDLDAVIVKIQGLVNEVPPQQ